MPDASRAVLDEFTAAERPVRRSADAPSHAGLLLDRYLTDRVDTPAHDVSARRSLLQHARAATENAQKMYGKACCRWLSGLTGAGHIVRPIHVQGRLIVGLGNDNVLESGITLHRLYGVPVIPGSALKGLASHYCDCVWGNRPLLPEGATAYSDSIPDDAPSDDQLRFRCCHEDEDPDLVGGFHRILFGTTREAGHLIFHDAWIDPDSLTGSSKGLVTDVLTPHHSSYYSGETDTDAGDRSVPSDFDDPKPITFPAAAGRFHVALSCEDTSPTGVAFLELGWRLLMDALEHWGVGGKTSAGYGRCTSDRDANTDS